MLDLFDRNPQSRVFQVDRECYIVYLGSDWEDYKPFLRLGTSTQLPSNLPPIVSSIIVPDVLTGNPLDEPASLGGSPSQDTHYIGDVETVEALERLVGLEEIPVSAIEEIDHEEDDAKHVLVYYYKDGNLKIKFRKNEIFDLRRREKLDGHFVARANEVKNQYGRGPFKFPGDAYQSPGFLVSDGKPYLLARGQLAALSLTPEYFFSLSAAAVDADRVTTVRSDEADAALIRFFKRSRTRNRAVHVVSSRLDRVTAATSIFRENSLLPVRALPIDASSGEYEFQRFAVSEADGRTTAALEGREGSLVFGASSKSDGPADIRIDGASIHAPGQTYSLLEGAIYQITDATLTRTVAEESLPEKSYPYRDLLSQAENNLLGQIQYFFSELFAGRDASKVLRTLKNLDVVKGRESAHPIVQILVHNTIEFSSFLGETEKKFGTDAAALASTLSRLQINRSAVPTYLPIVGEIYSTESRTYILYRFAQRITSDRFAHAEQVAQAIAAVPEFDYEGERQRLSDLVAGLATPEQMDEARMRRIAETKKPTKKERPAAEVDRSAADPQPSAQDPAGRAGSGDARGEGRGGSRAGRGSGGRGGWIIAAAAVLIIAILIALLATGTISNPWFGNDPGGIASSDTDPDPASSDGSSDSGSAGRDGADASADAASGDSESGSTETSDSASDAAQRSDSSTGADGQTDSGTDTSPDGTSDASTSTDAASTTSPEVVPPGWEDSLPALRALDGEPDVIITDTTVIGPGGIEITLNDIIALVNEIATDNGFDTMDEENPLLPDPDWIYPGNVFVLPNTARYTVQQGDSIWVISVRYMVARLRLDYAAYTNLVREHENAATTAPRRGTIVSELNRLASESHSENFTLLVSETLTRWREE